MTWYPHVTTYLDIHNDIYEALLSVVAISYAATTNNTHIAGDTMAKQKNSQQRKNFVMKQK